jgi:hypothetical protein
VTVLGRVGGLPADVPVDLTREQARRLAELELADPAYRAAEPGPIERVLRWLQEWLQEALDRFSGAAPGGWLGVLGLLALVVVAVLIVRWRMGPVSRAAAVPFTVDPATSAAEYRRRAEGAAASGQWDVAVSERMRALVRVGQERGLIDAQPGWTADEVAAALGGALPGSGAILATAATAFDEVRYGGRPATRSAYEAVRAADDRVRTERAPVA